MQWRAGSAVSHDPDVLRPFSDPFDASGGLVVLRGNLGRSAIKISAVKPEHRVVEAPARVFRDQIDVARAFEAGELNHDVVVVVTHQGPRANGMPELHKLTPALGSLQDHGHAVALVTDGRMSGASGKVPAAIHLSPEAVAGGPIAKLRDGDIVRLDAEAGVLEVKLSDEELAARTGECGLLPQHQFGLGRELFANARQIAGSAESGGSFLFAEGADLSG